MRPKTPRAINDVLSIPHPSSKDLRGKQSVRATFRLSRRAIETISILAVQLGIKKKSLFDHLIEDMDALDRVARHLNVDILQGTHRVQKTYVLNRRTLRCLDQTSKAYNAPRDALVESSIQRLLPLVTRELEKHRVRKRVMAETEAFFDQGNDILQKTIASLGEEDPVSIHFKAAMRSIAHARNQVAACVEKGEELEDFIAAFQR